MSQQTLDGTTRGDRAAREDDQCGEAVMAAMQAISEHCDTEGVPMQMSGGMVAMVPKEDVDEVENMAPQEMSDREIMDMMEDSPWMGEWTDGICSQAGLEEGTDAFRRCKLNYARDALR